MFIPPALRITRLIKETTMNKNNNITKEYLEKNFVTKDYLDKKLDNFVTKEDLKKEFTFFKGEIISEVRKMNYELVNNIVENAKTYYLDETKKHMTALREGFRDDLKGYKDQVTTVSEKVEKCEERLDVLELKIV